MCIAYRCVDLTTSTITTVCTYVQNINISDPFTVMISFGQRSVKIQIDSLGKRSQNCGDTRWVKSTTFRCGTLFIYTII